jgi:DUF971 family protein
MPASSPDSPMPLAMRKEGDSLVIEWSDGCTGKVSWKALRDDCPCAGCRDERQKPADPFRILKPAEIAGPLAPVSMPRVGRYAYKIVWNDGHDTGIYTLEHLHELCQCP